jgi:Antitoxin SocA-like, Panacea domain
MNRKLAQMLLYVAHGLAGDRWNGKTKIHKILFFSDFEAYRQTGRSISGENYIKFDQGPFLRAIEPTVQKMAHSNLAAWAPQNEWGEIQLAPRMAEIPTNLLSEQEMAIIDATIQRFWGWTATAVSNQSHRLFGWLTTPNGTVIPYNSAYVGDPRPLKTAENDWALDLIGRYREWKREKAEYCP